MTLPSKVVAMLDCTEQDDSEEGVEENQQEHPGDDEETLQHGHHHSLCQHLQGRLHKNNIYHVHIY